MHAQIKFYLVRDYERIRIEKTQPDTRRYKHLLTRENGLEEWVHVSMYDMLKKSMDR